MNNMRPERIEELMLELVQIRSDTGTSQEKDVETFIEQWLRQCDYFKQWPDRCGRYDLSGDPLQRSAVWGLIKGRGDRTVILMHHHDVVDAFDYGDLQKWAYDPPKLHSALAGMELPAEARLDLESGDWIFGRGTGDMKAGAAIQLVLLEGYSRKTDLKGNILLLSVPDEENLSQGMRGSLSLLVDLQKRFNLDYRLLINSEPHAKEDNRTGIFHIGSAGKLLPVIYVRGKKSHIGHIYEGFNPVLLLSEIVLETELNTEFCDSVRGEVSPPPSWSYMRDNKEVYDASIPGSAGGYLSLISLKRSPLEAISHLTAICEQAVRHINQKIRLSHAAHSLKSARQETRPAWNVPVLTFSELYRQALEDSGPAFAEAYRRGLQTVKSEIEGQRLNSPQATFKIIELALKHVADLSPMVVIALSPPYYPPIHNDEFQRLPAAVAELGDVLIKAAARRWAETYREKNYIMGITDLSYAALQGSEDVAPFIGSNMPLWRQTYDIPFAEMKALSVPVINIGPWGKDLHKFTERVYRPDLGARTPVLVECAINYLLEQAPD